jgi:predicted nucleotidyltransferase
MTRDEIIAKLKETAPALRAKGVTRLAIFGSRARGDERDDSDLDVLIDVNPRKFAGSTSFVFNTSSSKRPALRRRLKCAARSRTGLPNA